jgi:hypothetical protein
MQKILSAFFAFVLIIGSPVNVAMALGGGTYYVDASTPAGTGDGSLANPWTTISEAVAVAASGDTVAVAPGIYDVALGESFPLYPATGTSIIGAPGARIIQDEFTPTGISVPVFDYDGAGYGPTLLSGFTISAIQDAISIRPFHSSSSTTAVAGFEISNNHIDSIVGGGVYFYASYDDRATLNVHDNTFNVASVSADHAETLMGSIVISNNTFTDSAGDAINGYLYFDENTSVSLSVDISGNTITNPAGSGIEYNISVDESEVAGYASVSIEGNTISGAGSQGINFEFDVSSSSNELAANVTITNNTVSDSNYTGIVASAGVEYTSNSIAYDLTLDSNTVTGSEYGIYIYASNSDEATVNYDLKITNNTVTGSDYEGLYMSFWEDYSESAFMSVDMTISGNTLESNGGDGLYIYFSDSSGGNQSGQEWNVRLDNNTITDNGDSGIFLSFSGALSSSSPGAVDILLDFGTVTDAGANVIHSNLVDGSSTSYSSSSSYAYADNDGIGMQTYTNKSWMPDILAIGNDWGTTDVESVIFHQVDAAILPLVIFDEPSTGDNFFAPQAIYDPVATDMETAVTLDVSANDTDLDGNLDATSVVIVQSASHGSVVNNGDGTVTYTPDVGWYGGDTIVYNISDTFGLVSNNATIGVMVNGTSNTIPTANSDSAGTELGVAVTIDVMANDTDADGDALDASSVAVNTQGNKGTAVVNGDGTITYTPAPSHQFGLNSTDSFTYTVNDVNGGVSNIATVELKLTLGGSTIR